MTRFKPSDEMSKVQLRNIWKIFGPNPRYVFESMDPSASQGEIMAKTGHVVAVRDVSININQGEIFVVMGLSGSGKSTLVRCLSRLIEPTAGQVIIDDADVTAMKADELRHLRRHTVSMVFQRFGLFPHRRIIDNVGYGLEVQGASLHERRSKARQVLELVGLDGWENHYPHELSGGMQQRVGLARALAVDPDVMLCDEPFSALDPLIRREMQNELLNLQQSLHKTIIFITHDFLEAIKLGERVAIMKDGEIVQIGTSQEIVAHPVNDYVLKFTQDVPRAKVLTAESIMQPANGSELPAGQEVAASTTLEKLIPQISTGDGILSVVNEEGTVIGVVDRHTVLMALGET
jgi:glycine betaine/proline transport system ATP-binding protein